MGDYPDCGLPVPGSHTLEKLPFLMSPELFDPVCVNITDYTDRRDHAPPGAPAMGEKKKKNCREKKNRIVSNFASCSDFPESLLNILSTKKTPKKRHSVDSGSISDVDLKRNSLCANTLLSMGPTAQSCHDPIHTLIDLSLLAGPATRSRHAPIYTLIDFSLSTGLLRANPLDGVVGR